jgi:hypothetical protein
MVPKVDSPGCSINENIVPPISPGDWERRGWEVLNVCSFVEDFAHRNDPVDSRFVRASDLEDVRVWFSTVVLADKLQKQIGQSLANLALKLFNVCEQRRSSFCQFYFH